MPGFSFWGFDTVQIPFVGAAYQSRSSNIAAERCVNLYPEVSGTGDAKTVAALIGCPGKRLLVSLAGIGGIRALFMPSNGNLIAVRGNRVYRVSSAWVGTQVGTLATSAGVVKIKDNGTDAFIGDGTYGYTLNLLTNAFTNVTDPDFTGSDCVEFIDGYFIFNRPNTQQFFISGLYTTDFDALEFASAEGAPDNVVSILADHRELWIFGDSTTEVFQNTGNVDFPFERLGGAFIEHGCAAKHSVAKLDNTVFWLGKDENGQGMVWRAQGYTPARVSTHAIEHAISGYGDISDAFGWTYQQEGHSFYVLTFPTAGKTWAFDAATGLWHERAYRNPSDGSLTRERSSCHAFFGDEHVVGDWESGNLYALDLDYYSDNGDPMPAIRATGYVKNPDNREMRFNALHVDMETGVGLETGEVPQAMLRWSANGKTWSNEHSRSIGAVGEYIARARWTRLGKDRQRIFELTITDPVKRVILAANADVALLR